MSDFERQIQQLAEAQVYILTLLQQSKPQEDRLTPLRMAYYLKLEEAKQLACELLKHPRGIH